MKYLLLFLLNSISFIAFSQSKDERAVRQLLSNQQAAWNRGDIDSFMKGYWNNDSLTFTGKNGVTYGWTKTLNNYKKNYPDTVTMGKLLFTIVEAKPLSTGYFSIIGKWQLTRTIGNLQGYFSLLFRNIKGEWKIIADHTS